MRRLITAAMLIVLIAMVSGAVSAHHTSRGSYGNYYSDPGVSFLVGGSYGHPSYGYGYGGYGYSGGAIYGNGFAVSRNKQTITEKGYDQHRVYGSSSASSNSNYHLPSSTGYSYPYSSYYCRYPYNSYYCRYPYYYGDNYHSDGYDTRKYDVTERNDWDRSTVIQNDNIVLGNRLGYGHGYLGRRNFYYY